MGLSVAIKVSIAARFAMGNDGDGSAQHDESRPDPRVKIFGNDNIMMKANNIVL